MRCHEHRSHRLCYLLPPKTRRCLPASALPAPPPSVYENQFHTSTEYVNIFSAALLCLQFACNTVIKNFFCYWFRLTAAFPHEPGQTDSPWAFLLHEFRNRMWMRGTEFLRMLPNHQCQNTEGNTVTIPNQWSGLISSFLPPQPNF